MSTYAAQTEVSSEKSRAEIERTLARYGADGFMYGWQGSQAVVAFTMNDRSIKFILPLPDRSSRAFTHHSRGQRTPDAAREAWEQACRQRWRALALCIKAKLEAVECKITSFDSEFLAHFVTNDGRTVGEHIIPQLNENAGPPTLRLTA